MATTTAILEAVRTGDLDGVRSLVADHPALAAATDEEGISASLLALYFGHAEIVQALLETQPELTVFEAAALGDRTRAEEMLEQDPSLVRAWSPDGFTLLHLAAFFGHEEIVELLLSLAADVSTVARGSIKVQPLQSAVTGRHTAIAARLLAHGADVNAREQSGFTPLHAAAQNGDEASVQLLLRHGANVRALTGERKSPADYARDAGHEGLARSLQEATHSQ
jgi:ankyrin repeat protein